MNGQITAADLIVTGQKNYPSYPNEILSVQLNQPAANGVRVNLAEESRFEYSGATEVNKALNTDGLAGVTFTAIPEPSAYALFGLGAVALLIAARRKLTA